MSSSFKLPAHWPRYTTEEYYSWMMEQMPAGAIVADWSKHKPHGSYSPIFWYADQHCVCVHCKKEFTFSKEEQKYWYEEAKLPIQVQAIRCPDCRKRLRQDKTAQKKHMEEMAEIPPHPNEAFFRK